MMIKVIIVDDQLLFRMGVRGMIESRHADISIVGEAASGEEFFRLLEIAQPDIVLLDIVMPGMSGIEIARRLKQERPEIRILAISSENSEGILKDLFDIGIAGFICKRNCADDELPAAIRSIINGLEYYGKDIARIIYQLYVAKTNATEIAPEFTEREIEIINLCRDRLLSKEIADRLGISPRTVETHKNNIFRKLGIKCTNEMVQYGLKTGLIKMEA